MATGVSSCHARKYTEAHTHTIKKQCFFSLSIVVASTVLVLCGGVLGKVVFASAHHVEVGPVGRASSSSIGSSAKQHVHAIQRPNLPAACTRWRTPTRAATNYYYYYTTL